MVITYHGGEFFKVSFGNTTLAFNPISKKSKLKNSSFGADIVFVSLNHPDMNGIEQVTRGEKEPFVINGPGEYEIQGVAVRGIASDSKYNEEGGINTIYVVTLENMYLCFLGALASRELPQKAKEAIEQVDILFVPIGGDGVLSASDAHELSVKLEPHVVIPMHYGEIGKKGALDAFLKEEGKEKTKPTDKLSVKRKDVEMKQGEIVVLAS